MSVTDRLALRSAPSWPGSTWDTAEQCGSLSRNQLLRRVFLTSSQPPWTPSPRCIAHIHPCHLLPGPPFWALTKWPWYHSLDRSKDAQTSRSPNFLYRQMQASTWQVRPLTAGLCPCICPLVTHCILPLSEHAF